MNAPPQPLTERAWQEEEAQKRIADEHHDILRNFGIATAIIGGTAGLAYLDRDGDGGRAIAIGSGVVAGVALLGGLAFAMPAVNDKGANRALTGLVLGILGGVVGGVVAAKFSSQPGTARFTTAAVSLSGLWLLSVGLAIRDW